MTPLELVAAVRAHWIAADRPRQRTRVHDADCWQMHAACALERLCQAVETLHEENALLRRSLAQLCRMEPPR